MSFNTTSTLLCVSSSTETIHLFKLTHPGPSSEGSMSAVSSVARERNFSQDSSSQFPEIDDMAGELGASELSGRKHNGTFMGIIRRTSQSVGSTVAAKVGGYLPKGVSEMWEPARDFAWIKLPKPNQGPGGNGSAPLRSVVAMSSNTPQVMVVTSDGNFYVFNIDLSKGGEGTLTKQYSYVSDMLSIEVAN